MNTTREEREREARRRREHEAEQRRHTPRVIPIPPAAPARIPPATQRR